MTGAFHEHADWQSSGQLLKVLGHPIRLQIVSGLLSGACNVGHIWHCLCLPQPTVSQHLRVLRAAGVVVAHRHGKEVVYEVTDPRVPELLAALGINLDACAEILRQRQNTPGVCTP
ncbi:MAG: ArsR family transcriptional regulator [Candidatus Dadabacteria bacterium]|nr:MAG: ArsR family transcriptional regulator [Candidatus Dadabacteria bacterium]